MKAHGHRGLCPKCAHNQGATGGPTGVPDRQNRPDVQVRDGAAWGNRTPDLFITSESLYRLS